MFTHARTRGFSYQNSTFSQHQNFFPKFSRTGKIMTHPTLNINTHCILICQSGENPRIKTRTNTERSYHDDYFQCKCCHSYFTTQMIEVGAKYTPLRVRPMTDFFVFFFCFSYGNTALATFRFLNRTSTSSPGSRKIENSFLPLSLAVRHQTGISRLFLCAVTSETRSLLLAG